MMTRILLHNSVYWIRFHKEFKFEFFKCSDITFYVTRPLFGISVERIPPLYKWILTVGWITFIRIN